MATQKDQSPAKLFAVFIGINDYPNNPLHGCINDILAVSDYFDRLCHLQRAGSIAPDFLYLLAPHDEEKAGIAKAGITYQAPSRENIMSAFTTHFSQADPQRGDFCLLYYSGHGSLAEAPAVFSEVQPSLIFQTLCLPESRTAGRRDLIDKELGFLIAEAMQGKESNAEAGIPGVHFLSIMDCCHSGSNTRDDGTETKVRRTRSGPAIKGTEHLHGFDHTGNFYYKPVVEIDGKLKIPRGGIRHGRHINLSAARDAETAKEKALQINDKMVRHGVFTYSLLKTLRQVGTHLSYRELIRRVSMEVSSKVDSQIPVMGQTIAADEDLLFLNNRFKTPDQEFEIGFRDGRWVLKAGALHGISSAKPNRPTIVKIQDKTQQLRGLQQERKVAVIRVDATESILDAAAFGEEDRERMFSASIDQMEVAGITLGPDPELPDEMRIRLEDLFANNTYHYLDWVDTHQAEFLVRNDRKHYVLTRAGGRLPLFDRVGIAAAFLKDAEKVGKWFKVLNMESGQAQTFRERRNHFRIDAWRLEGYDFGPEDFNDIPGAAYEKLAPNPDRLDLHYRQTIIHGELEDLPPAFRLRISLTKEAKYNQYWVGALYLNSSFGISHRYGPVQRLSVDESNEFMDLKYRDDTTTYEGFPMNLSKDYLKLGITNTAGYVIFFISNKEFDLDQYFQPSLPIFSANRQRDEGFEQRKSRKDFWFTIKLPIHLHRQVTEVSMDSGSTLSLPAMTVSGPMGFSALIRPISHNMAHSANHTETANRESTGAGNSLLPDDKIWQNAESTDAVFSAGRANADRGDYLSILELRRIEGDIDANRPLNITPAEPLTENQTIVPYAYDTENQLYYPIGYTNHEGKVIITHLPAPTTGLLATQSPQAEERGVIRSTKLFFHKLIWSNLTGRKDYHRLSMVYRDKHSRIQRYDYRQTTRRTDLRSLETIREAISSTTDQHGILLLVHGLIGDTANMEDAIFNKTDLHQRFGAILAFNYENLHTSIADAGKSLGQMLRECGIENQNITLVAHSTGGLVARWYIEHAGGDQYVRQFIQAGAPNGGTELARLRQKAFDGLLLALNGVKKLEPFLTIGSFIFKGLEKLYFRAANQVVPGSEVLLQLNSLQKNRPELPVYDLIAGNTADIEALLGEHNSGVKKFLAKMAARGKYQLFDKVVFKDLPNDWMVLIDSMREVPGGHDTIREVNCDHFGYFDPGEGLDALVELIQSTYPKNA